MRLKLIKIAGFKSFVEPTRLVLPSELVGIVGPNGCGKSNTLDAVRWVMGESSARELRGGDMNDVLFNGSEKRKAVSQCSVELLFDNESGTAGGAYASYSEISVKRVHHREDGTRYFLNQQACRRRDIIDLFNGTGLGPRSYALIGQGNISRIIEAKPEDMRVVLEEVAGIGPYRSRRKETLLRLNRTRENLSQLSVLQEALSEQAAHLETQAEKARDHRQSMHRQQALEKTLYYLQWHQLHQQQTRAQSGLRMAEKNFSQAKAEWDSAQKNALLVRQQLPSLQSQAQAAESHFHQLDKKLEKLKQQQSFSGQQSQQWLDQQALNQQQSQMHDAQLNQINQQLAELQLDIDALDEQLEIQNEQLDEYEALGRALNTKKLNEEHALQKIEWRSQQAEQAFKAHQQKLTSLEQIQTHLTEQIQWMRAQLDDPQSDQAESQLDGLITEKHQLNTLLEQQNQQLGWVESELKSAQLKQDQARQQHQVFSQQYQTHKAEHQALDKIQQRLVGQVDQALPDEIVLTDLVSQLKVHPDWQTAVEAWLGARLHGVVLEQPLDWDQLEYVPKTHLLGWNPPPLEVHPQSLAAQISQPECVRFLAKDVFVLSPGQSINDQLAVLSTQTSNTVWLINQQGALFADSVCLPAVSASQGSDLVGSLERQSQIEWLAQALDDVSDKIEQIDIDLIKCNQQVEVLGLQTSEHQARCQDTERQVLRLVDQIGHLEQTNQAWLVKQRTQQQGLDELAKRVQSGQQQQAELALEMEALNQQFEQWDLEEEQASQVLEKTQAQLVPIEREREKLTLQTQRTTQQVHQQKQAYQQLVFQQQHVQQQCKQDVLQAELIQRHLAQAMPVDDVEIEQVTQALALAESERELFKQQLDAMTVDAELCQQQADEAQQRYHQTEQSLVTEQLQLQAMQQQIQQLQKTVEAQGLSFYQLAQLRFDEQPLEQVEAELKQVKLHLNRLGAVNMTAIEEFEQVKLRLDQLIKQINDLTQSIETLEQAIAHIDQDSRKRLVETFEQVNQGFQGLFPRLFRGGEAHLSWLDKQQDPLEGGVVVMARPPGKRNSRIQLLSGGEKTLSAIALIFAIFELKPAPFCILDEVDAPLDDSNVIRFCGLVRSLSEKVQFIYITHNKTTMAMAKHLVGVTMHEPGVSRLVSVDLDAAVEMIGDQVS